MQHVITQLPYSITVGTCSAIGFLIGGMVSPVLGLVTTAVTIVLAFFVLHKYAEKKYKTIS